MPTLGQSVSRSVDIYTNSYTPFRQPRSDERANDIPPCADREGPAQFRVLHAQVLGDGGDCRPQETHQPAHGDPDGAGDQGEDGLVLVVLCGVVLWCGVSGVEGLTEVCRHRRTQARFSLTFLADTRPPRSRSRAARRCPAAPAPAPAPVTGAVAGGRGRMRVFSPCSCSASERSPALVVRTGVNA
jgi:hypothetical protein